MSMENLSRENNISAILLAAGVSTRMGRPKLLLPWGGTTVLGQVISTFANAGIRDIILVTGGAREPIEAMAKAMATSIPVRSVFNPDFSKAGMLSSIKAGLEALSVLTGAALIGLGDQPQVKQETIRRICTVYGQTLSPLVIPSFQNKRGHPWLASSLIWQEILALPPSSTSRQFLNTYSGRVEYVSSDESILQDLDTPEDYARHRP